MKGKRGARQSAAFEPLEKWLCHFFEKKYTKFSPRFLTKLSDGISFYSAACGRRDSLREGLFRPLKRGARRSAAFELVKKVLQAPALIGAK